MMMSCNLNRITTAKVKVHQYVEEQQEKIRWGF